MTDGSTADATEPLETPRESCSENEESEGVQSDDDQENEDNRRGSIPDEDIRFLHEAQYPPGDGRLERRDADDRLLHLYESDSESDLEVLSVV